RPPAGPPRSRALVPERCAGRRVGTVRYIMTTAADRAESLPEESRQPPPSRFRANPRAKRGRNMLTERLIAVIANFTQVPPEQITPDTTFPELGLDSLQGLNLLYDLENEFQVSIPNNRAMRIRGVRDLLEVMDEIMAGQGAAAQPADVPQG